MGLLLNMLWKLQLVQNVAAQMLTGKNRFRHLTPLLWELHWLLAVVHAQVKVLLITYKALYGLGPGCLNDSLSQHFFCATFKIFVEARLVVINGRGFSVVATRLWNSLPIDTCLALHTSHL